MARFGFLLLVGVAAVLSEVPILGLPLKWIETYFHEISHGLAAIVTGGSILRYELSADGSGLCYNAGGWRLIVAFAGYAGASLWGWLVFVMAGSVSPEGGRWLAAGLAVLVAASWLFWGSGTETAILVAVIVVVFAAVALAGRYGLTRLVLAFIGVSVAVSAIRAPLVLLVFGGESDARTLAGLTFLPRFIWVAAWCGLAIYVLYRMWRTYPKMKLSTRRT